MPQSDILLTLAEIAVAFAGFSSLVALLGSRRGASHPDVDAVRLQVMLEASLFVALMSVVPFLPSSLGSSPETTWRISAGVFLGTDALATVVSARRWKAVALKLTAAERSLTRPAGVLSLGADLLVLLVLAGLAEPIASGLYLAALVANLVLAGALFIRFAASTFLATTGE